MGRGWVGVELLYNSVHRKFKEFGDQESWRNDAVEKAAPSRSGPRDPDWVLWIRRVGDKMQKRKPAPREAGPQVPGWAAQVNGKETLMAIRVEVNMLQFCSVSNSLLRTTLSNKVRGIFFLKELCRSSLLCRCVLHAYVDVYVWCVCIVSRGHGFDYTTLGLISTRMIGTHPWR